MKVITCNLINIEKNLINIEKNLKLPQDNTSSLV